MDLALNNLQGLICHKNQPTNQPVIMTGFEKNIKIQNTMVYYFYIKKIFQPITKL